MKITFDGFCRFWFLLGLGGLISMLPFSKIVISISEMVIVTAWALQRFDAAGFTGRLKQVQGLMRAQLAVTLSVGLFVRGIATGFRDLYRNKPAFIFFSVFLLHVAGLLFTTDFGYAMKDLRTKLPLLILPLVFGTVKPVGRKLFNAYLFLFLLALLIGTMMYSWKIYHLEFIDIRDVSRNVSHIILGLELALGIFILARFAGMKDVNPALKILSALLIGWFLIYILYSRSFTGLGVFVLSSMVVLPVLVFRQKRPGLRILFAAVMIISAAGGFLYVRSIVKEYYTVHPVDKSRLDYLTALGNPYTHNLDSDLTENGNYLYLYCQFSEMRTAWNKRSRIPYDSNGINGEKIEYTLVRFLTSKNLRKDASGVSSLSTEEILAVERGIPNYLFLEKFSMRSRIYELIRDYDNYRLTGNPTGATLMQRLEFWKASAGIIGSNWIYGVGTGDMNEAFSEQYVKMNTKLPPDQRWRSHNQYLSVLVGFGVIGFLWFLFAFLYPAIRLKGFGDFYFLTFIIIAALSMLTEDTMESQMGVTFITFFYCFFLFGRREFSRI